MKVKVIENGLKFFKTDSRGRKQSFFPRIGQIITLDKEAAKKEIEGGNVRSLLPEEKVALKRRIEAKKKVS